MFACGLPGIVSDDEAGVLIDAVGLQKAGELVGEALQASFPQAEAKPSVNPRKATAGTGSRS
jgi:hypothetical protein